MAVEAGLSIFLLVKHTRLSATVDKEWYAATDVAREYIQKKVSMLLLTYLHSAKIQCCGFYNVNEDIRCSRLYNESCGEKVIEQQGFSLLLTFWASLLSTTLDTVLFLMGLYLANIFGKNYEKRKAADRAEVLEIQKSHRIPPEIPSKRYPVRK